MTNISYGLMPLDRDVGKLDFIGYQIDSDNIDNPVELNSPTGTEADDDALAAIYAHLAAEGDDAAQEGNR
jgi:hypothetical protein